MGVDDGEGVFTHPLTGEPVAAISRYTYDDGHQRYVVTFTRHEDLASDRMIDSVTGIKRLVAKITRFDGAYLRFTGERSVQRFEGGTLAEHHEDTAIWELMYFGNAR